MIRRAIILFAAALSTTWAFAAVMISMLVFALIGAYWHFSDAWQLAFTLYLSVLAIVQASVILVGQSQGECAVHSKLDEIIRAIDKADNRLIGIEKADG